MEKGKRTKEGGHPLAVQIFNGKEYRLYPGERYFSRGTRRLHRVVWEYYNGTIPPGYQVHHKDGNPQNNDIGNLECVPPKAHRAKHIDEIIRRGKSEKSRKHLLEIRPLAAEWHRSEEGREWHRLHAIGKKEKNVECTCECCGSKFLSAYTDARFCSNKCKAKWRRDQHLDEERRTCVICGKEFSTNKFGDTICCSRSCGARYRISQRRAKGGL